MTHHLTNLLPLDRQRALRNAYFLRLGTVALSFLAVLVLVSAALLVPSYMYVVGQAQNEREALAVLEAQLSSSEEQEVVRRLTELERDARYLSTVGANVSATRVFESILLEPRAGTTLTGLTFTPPSGKAEGKVTLSGKAATRAALRQYQATLSAMPNVTSAELPISAYAREVDIPFTITVSGLFTP